MQPSPPLPGLPLAPPPSPPGQQCQARIDYQVNLGKAQNTSDVPFFLATVVIRNTDPANVTIEDWRTAWDFESAYIASQSSLASLDASLATPNSSHVELDWSASSRSPPLQPWMTFQLAFVANKEDGGDATNAALLGNMTFNNLICSSQNPNLALGPAAEGAIAPAASTVARVSAPEGPPPSVADPQDLKLVYVPITPVNITQHWATQFLVKLTNIRNDTVIPLDEVSFEYYLQGPPGVLPADALANPDKLFAATCSYFEGDCHNVQLEVLPGYPDIHGARFLLHISFLRNETNPYVLLPTGSSAVPALFFSGGNEGATLTVQITTHQGVLLLNATEDWSFIDTPRLEPEGKSLNVRRNALPNPHIPVFLNDTLVWGELPSAAPPPGVNVTLALAPPVGFVCDQSSGDNSICSYNVLFCCSSPNGEPVAASFLEMSGAVPAGEDFPSRVPAPAPLPAPTPSPSSGPLAGNPAPPPPSPPAQDGGSQAATIVLAVIVPLATMALLGSAYLAWHARRAARGHRVQPLAEAGAKEGGPGPGEDGEAGIKGSKPSSGAGSPPNSGSDGSMTLVGVKASAPSPTGPLTLWAGPLEHAPSLRARFDPGSAHSTPSSMNSSRPGTSGGAINAEGTGRPGAGLLPTAPPPPRSAALAALSASASLGVAPRLESDADLAAVFERLARLSVARDSEGGAWGSLGLRGGGGSGARAGSSPRLWRGNSLFAEEAAQASSTPQPQAPWPLDRKARTVNPFEAGPRFREEPEPPSSSFRRRGDPWEARRARGRASGSSELGSIRRTQSWSGGLEEAGRSPDAAPEIARASRAAPRVAERASRRSEPRQAPAAPLPPLPPVAPLPTCTAPGVELDVDYDTEVAPFLGPCLGTGGFGVVHQGTWRGRPVAIKLLPSVLPIDGPGIENLREALMREVSLASRFDCERLVRVYGASVRDARNVCLIMELMRGGNLAQRIHDRRKRRLGYLDILRLAHDVALALAYLHPTVVHRDLKPQNVLLDEDGRAKLADFGISRAKDPTKSYFTQVTAENGTPMYMSPEQLDGKDRVTEKVDVYSLGVMLNEAWTRKQPWRDTPSLFQIILKVAINGERPWLDPACPEPLKWLILKCWHQQAHMRPSCAEIVRITDILMHNEFARWGPAPGPPALRSSLSPSSSARSSPRHSGAV